MIFLNLVFLFHLSNSAPAHADDTENYEIITANNRFDDQIIHKHDLATQLGLRDPDAIFSNPRNFSSEELNTMQLDPLKSEDAEPVAPAKN